MLLWNLEPWDLEQSSPWALEAAPCSLLSPFFKK